MNQSVTASDLSVDERASLTSGLDFWHTKGIERLGVSSLMLTDGPHGVRKQCEGEELLGLAHSVPATCFPPAAGLASSFDVELLERVGVALGRESVQAGVHVLLGPGVNIKRSALGGRNFEYYSEDPVLSGALGAAWVRGVQSQGVAASAKHFAANNQEHDRMRVSSDVDPRTLREVYLRSFQKVVQGGRPWTIMCAYNRINGVYAAENQWLLTQVLRAEWGFDGVVMSDWGAVGDRVEALLAGLDLEMPATGGRTDRQLVDAVQNGTLDGEVLDRTADRMLLLAARTTTQEDTDATPVDFDAHHELAREAATRSIVLLKNDGGVLPLSATTTVAVIGPFAAEPRYQGAGSSLINPTRLDTALDAIRRSSQGAVSYAPGYRVDGTVDEPERAELRAAAIAAAGSADTAIVFLGLPVRAESEGFDRASIDLPADQLDLLDAVFAANENTVVVLSHGGVVAVPFAERAPAVLDGWLLGQAGGSAIADVLFGTVNPSGKLAETIPLRLSDAPAFLDFPGEFGHVRYSEGLFVGHRWYDARDLEVAFPFGHGLSYTSFEYSAVTGEATAAGDVEVQVRITNTGSCAGREVVQVYSGLEESVVQRPIRELKAFAVVDLQPGEARAVRLLVERNDLAYWDTRINGWVLEPGRYRFDVASSSRDLRGSTMVDLDGDIVALPLTRESSLAEIAADPRAAGVMREIAAARGESGAILALLLDQESEIGMLNASFPVARLSMMGITEDEIERLLDA